MIVNVRISSIELKTTTVLALSSFHPSLSLIALPNRSRFLPVEREFVMLVVGTVGFPCETERFQKWNGPHGEDAFLESYKIKSGVKHKPVMNSPSMSPSLFPSLPFRCNCLEHRVLCMEAKAFAKFRNSSLTLLVTCLFCAVTTWDQILKKKGKYIRSLFFISQNLQQNT